MQKIETRRNTNRIPQYNYSTPGQYFLTICVENRQQILGAVENGIGLIRGSIAGFYRKNIIHIGPQGEYKIEFKIDTSIPKNSSWKYVDGRTVVNWGGEGMNKLPNNIIRLVLFMSIQQCR